MDPLLLCACKRNRPPLAKPEDAMTGDLKVNPGKPLGAMATMTIGPAGGTLAFPHTGVKLTIPAGALKANVHFSIQQLKPTITGRLASGPYRLLPADVRFKKDINITLPCSNDGEIAAGRLVPIFQDGEGYWHLLKRQRFTINPHSLTISTRRLGDWAVKAMAYLQVHNRHILEKGQHTNIQAVLTSTVPATDQNKDTLLGADRPKVNAVKEWEMLAKGFPDKGTLSGGTANPITYRAPVDYPHRTMSVKLAAMLKPLQGESAPIRIYTQLTVLTEQYCLIRNENGNGTTGPAYRIYDQGIYVAKGERMYLEFSSGDARVTISAPDNKTGAKKFSRNVWLSHGIGLQPLYASTYTNCIPAGELFTYGTVVVLENNGKLVTGTSSGELRQRSPSQGPYCWGDAQPFQARFRYKVR